LELGEAKGDNWWCVVYPPLCFIENNQDILYKSKILEILKSIINGDK
jgi:stage II sporulation protein R